MCLVVHSHGSKALPRGTPKCGGVFVYRCPYCEEYHGGGTSTDTGSWPDEFICGSLHFDLWRGGYGSLVVTERHPEVVYADAWRYPVRMTRLDLLPLDMRRAILEPMCRRTLLSKSNRFMYGSRIVTSCCMREALQEMRPIIRGSYPCSLDELVDRWISGCQDGCLCSDQHGNRVKARRLARPLVETEPTLPPPRLTRREWRERNRR